MYALNTFLRAVRFVANSFIGLVVGFLVGVAYASNSSPFMEAVHGYLAKFF